MELQINDIVEVVNDHRQFLNGRRGTIKKITGDRAEVLFGEPINQRGYGQGAVIFLSNLQKCEEAG